MSGRSLLIIISWLIVAFGQPELSQPLALVAATVGFALFWVAISDRSGRFWKGILWFSSVSAVHLSWLASPLYQGYYIIGVYAFLCIALGLQFGLLSMLVKKGKIRHRLFLIAALWTLFEWSRYYFLSGYAWHPVGITLGSNLYTAQLASVGGVLFLSFWVMLTNLSALLAIEGSKEGVGVWFILTLVPYAFGAMRVATMSSDETIASAYLVQPSWLPDEKNEGIGGRLVNVDAEWNRLQKKVAETKTDYLILPEAAFPYGYSGSGAFAQKLSDQTGAEVIVGLDAAEHDKYYNAAFHFKPGTEPQMYAKRVLLPLAEMLPYEWLRPFVARYGITQFFTPGKEQTITGGKCPVALSVCYEECFPHLMRDAKLRGAKLLVNVTNDGWYAFSRLPAVHFYLARLRSIELGLPLVRASNTGYSAVIDRVGKIWTLFDTSYVRREQKIAIPSATANTLFGKFGNSIIFTICALSLGATILHLLLKKRAVNVLH